MFGGTPEVRVYGFMDGEMCQAFAATIASLQDANYECIKCRVNSPGGSVYDGIAMYNTVKNSRVPVDMYVDGLAASMASAFIQAGRKRYMSKYGTIMTHKPMSGNMGTAEELRATADEIDALEPMMLQMYCQATGHSAEQARAMFMNGKDNYFNAEQALAARLVDELYDADPVMLPQAATRSEIFAVYAAKLPAGWTLADATTTNEGLNNNLYMNKKEISLATWAKICATLGITDSVDDAGFEAAINKLVDKAKNHDIVAVKLSNKEAEIAAMKKEVVAEKVSGLLEAALKAKKITAAQKDIFAADYGENPDGLKRLLDSMGFTSIVGQLNQADKGAMKPEVKALVDLGYDKLHKSGRLGTLKAMDEGAFIALYKEKFGYEPNGKPTPKFK